MGYKESCYFVHSVALLMFFKFLAAFKKFPTIWNVHIIYTSIHLFKSRQAKCRLTVRAYLKFPEGEFGRSAEGTKPDTFCYTPLPTFSEASQLYFSIQYLNDLFFCFAISIEKIFKISNMKSIRESYLLGIKLLNCSFVISSVTL